MNGTRSHLKHYRWTVALIYTAALFLDRLDLTIVNITLPTLSHVFHVGILTSNSVTLAFLLALAVSTPASHWLGQRFGLKKVYVTAILLFGIGATLSGCTTSFSALVVLRWMQGLGGGLLIPVGLTMVYRLYEKHEYAHITSLTFIPSLIAPAIAPLFGGILLDTLGWRSVFLFSGPIALLLTVAAIFVLKDTPREAHDRFDLWGFVFTVILLLDAFYGLSSLARDGVGRMTGVELVLFFLCLYGFIWVEKHNPNPLIPLQYFKFPQFVQANLLQLCFQICHFGALFLMGMYLQVGVGFSASMAGLLMGGQAVSAMIVSYSSVILLNRYGASRPISIGLFGVAMVTPFILCVHHPHQWALGLTLFFIRGLFSGLCGTPIQTLSVMGLPKERLSTANGIFSISRQVSISLGVALSSLLLGFGLHRYGLSLNAFIYGFAAIPIVALLGVWLSLRLKDMS